MEPDLIESGLLNLALNYLWLVDSNLNHISNLDGSALPGTWTPYIDKTVKMLGPSIKGI